MEGTEVKIKNRRDKMKIYGDLLSILNAEPKSEKIILTRIQVKMNVPFDRFKQYLSDLEALGFIDNPTSLRLTDKGRRYLEDYRKILDLMDHMGISYR
jgi:predicted transcriptional regulator